MYAYLFGTIGLAIVFSLLCIARKDLRRVMVYGGMFYLLFMTGVFLLLKVLSADPAKAIDPGYWSPPSIFNLNRVTGGYGFEDVLYMFFIGAIAAGLYDILLNYKISKKSNRKLKKGHSLLFAMIISATIYTFTSINTVDFFIIFQFTAAVAILWQRRDLIKHALGGGLFFMLFYALLFTIFRLLFPSFLKNYYHLDRTTNIWVLGIPLEEYLYALTLGFAWGPIYEYEFRIKDKKRRSTKPRRFSLALQGARH